MPYILKEFRDKLDPSINRLIEDVTKTYEDSSTQTRDGLLNYAFTRILAEVYQKPSYHNFNEIIGVLEACKLEFYRKRISVYEDLKESENGTV